MAHSLQRRDFLKAAGTGALVVASPLSFAACTSEAKTEISTINKVKMAMLSMQRASWEQGIAMQALWEMGDSELAYLLAKEAVLRQATDGRLSVLYTDNGVTDPAASGEVVAHMGKIKNDQVLLDAHHKMLDYYLNHAPRSSNGIIYHTLNAPEIWIDSMYMLPPYLCIAGQAELAIQQINGYREHLWNDENQLYSHRYHVGDQAFINEKFWGVGNGWALAAMARFIDDLPQHMEAERNQIIRYALANLEGCLKYLRTDGLFHNIIDQPNTFVETNLAQMAAYTIFRGIRSGWLADAYLDKALLMRNAAYAKVDEHGYVQGVCGAPWFNSAGRATEGQAFFLLMEAAYQKMNEH